MKGCFHNGTPQRGYPYCDWLRVYVLQRYAEYLARAIAPRPRRRSPSALRASSPLAPPHPHYCGGAAEGYPSRR